MIENWSEVSESSIVKIDKKERKKGEETVCK